MGTSFQNVSTKISRLWRLNSPVHLILAIMLICARVSPQRPNKQSFPTTPHVNSTRNSPQATPEPLPKRIQWLEDPKSIASLPNLFELVEKAVLQNRLMMDSKSVQKYLLRAGRSAPNPNSVLALFQFQNLNTRSSMFLGIEYVLQDESKFENPETVDSLNKAGGLGVTRVLQTPDLDEFKSMFGLTGVDILHNKTELRQSEWAKVRHRYKRLNKRLYFKTYQEIKKTPVKQKLDRNLDRTQTFPKVYLEIKQNEGNKRERKSFNKRVIKTGKVGDKTSNSALKATSIQKTQKNDSNRFKVLHFGKSLRKSVKLDNLGLFKPVRKLVFNRLTGRIEFQIRKVKIVKPKADSRSKTLPSEKKVLRANSQLKKNTKLSESSEIKQTLKTKQTNQKKSRKSEISIANTQTPILKSKQSKLTKERIENDFKNEPKVESKEKIRVPPKQSLSENIESNNIKSEIKQNQNSNNENKPLQNTNVGKAVLKKELSRLDEILARLSKNQKINPDITEIKTVPSVKLPVLQTKDISSLFESDSPKSLKQKRETNFDDLSAFTKQDTVRNNTPKE